MKDGFEIGVDGVVGEGLGVVETGEEGLCGVEGLRVGEFT